MRKVAALAAASACTLAFAASALGAAANAKFTFENVTFPNGTIGTIQAGSKTTGNGSTFTNCGFYDSAGKYLGQFQSATFASDDAAAVRQFCLANFDNRTV
jgi:hypothetical protein